MVTLAGLVLVAIFASLCASGGQGIKQLRRFIAPIIFGLGIIGLAYLTHKLSLLVALGCIWYCPSLNIFKYGVNDGKLWKKILLRGTYGGSLGLSGLLIGLGTNNLPLGIAQLTLATVSSILLGVLNPFPNRWANWATIVEDLCIYALAVILIPWMM